MCVSSLRTGMGKTNPESFFFLFSARRKREFPRSLFRKSDDAVSEGLALKPAQISRNRTATQMYIYLRLHPGFAGTIFYLKSELNHLWCRLK